MKIRKCRALPALHGEEPMACTNSAGELLLPREHQLVCFPHAEPLQHRHPLLACRELPAGSAAWWDSTNPMKWNEDTTKHPSFCKHMGEKQTQPQEALGGNIKCLMSCRTLTGQCRSLQQTWHGVLLAWNSEMGSCPVPCSLW